MKPSTELVITKVIASLVSYYYSFRTQFSTRETFNENSRHKNGCGVKTYLTLCLLITVTLRRVHTET